jgi:hypothetical protein
MGGTSACKLNDIVDTLQSLGGAADTLTGDHRSDHSVRFSGASDVVEVYGLSEFINPSP